MRLDRLRSVHALLLLVGLLVFGVVPASAEAGTDPLPSWNEGATKQSIIDYVTRVTKQGGPDYVEPKDRLATIDNDGTLWVEKPMYTQFVFAVDEVKTPGQSASRMEIQGAVQIGARRRHEGGRGDWRKGNGRDRGGDPFRHDHHRFQRDGQAVARDRQASALQGALHRPRLSADDRAARLSPRERLQDLHRLRRRRRVHAHLRRQNLRHPARAGHRLLRRHPISGRGTRSRC